MRVLWMLVLAHGLARAAPESSNPDVVAELASVQLEEPPLEDPPSAAVAKARTDRLTTALRCPVCQGLSVSSSPSDAARAMAGRIEELVEAGYTEDQITGYFVDRYGAWVELEPPAEGWNKVLFVAPAVVVVLGGLWLGLRMRKQSAPRSVNRPQAYVPDPALAPYRERILAELEAEA